MNSNIERIKKRIEIMFNQYTNFHQAGLEMIHENKQQILKNIEKTNEIKKIKDTNNTLLYSVPYRPKTNAIESWFNQFKHYFQLQKGGISYEDLIKKVKITIKKIPNTSYLNYMKYAYVNKDVRKFIKKEVLIVIGWLILLTNLLMESTRIN